MALKHGLKVVTLKSKTIGEATLKYVEPGQHWLSFVVVGHDANVALVKVSYDSKNESKMGSLFADAADLEQNLKEAYDKYAKQEVEGAPPHKIPLIDGVESVRVSPSYEDWVIAQNQKGAEP